MFSRTRDILNYARLSKAGCSRSFFNNNNNDNNNNSSTIMITIMIITMLMIMIMIMIMAIAIPMGIAMIMITLTLLLNEINIPFAAEASFLQVPIINGAQKNCLLFIFNIEVSIVFKII